ncbi:hypothetical protein [Deinococcus cellulosilyticus]|uniref:Uncharacterized protein n=1 Tax=Deinococcus cellulosilyticus (strain DSM 18568 / NBRC 106333 / KACC 11606 / 5516J-15) TaxID=1223518 RepID=A0A511MZW9_DEIC1|nr:hypothetical protein [Deinococcus cellulosilyticus]GEM46134.1 hypothetical protein DC3_17690 [Deinococcus cellulosilyticus NBRC 106333 = KACC 11606]
MRGLSPEAMVLEEIRQMKLITPEEYLLIRTYIQTRTDHTSASQIKEIHQALQDRQISQATFEDTKAKLITRIRKEVKTREIVPLAAEAEEEKPRRNPLLLVLMLGMLVVGVGLTVSGIFGVKETETSRFLKAITVHPSSNLPMERFRQPDGTYAFDYPGTKLGESSHLVWFSPEKWWIRIERPLVQPSDFGRAREIASGLWQLNTSLGTLYAEVGTTGLHLRSEAFQKSFSGK